MADPAKDGTRRGAGKGGDMADDDAGLAGRVDEMERQLLRTQVRQRALIRALARMSDFTSGEMERLAAAD